MKEKTITVRCSGTNIESVDGDLIDVTLKNVNLSSLLCEFNIDDIVEALIDSDKSAEVITELSDNSRYYDYED